MMPRSLMPPSLHTPSTLRTLLAALAVLLATALTPRGAYAQIDDSTAKVSIRVLANTSQVSPGDQAAIAVVFEHASGWHTQTNDPQVPEQFKDLAPIKTEIITAAPAGVRVGPTQWPTPKPYEVGFLGEPVTMEFFSGKAVAFVPITIDANTPVGSTLTISFKLTFQACNDRTCLFPADVEEKIELPVVAIEGRANTPPPAADAAFFESFDPSVYSRMLAGETVVATQTFDFFGFRFDLAQNAYLLILAIAFLAGFLLNLTPCVLPVIPLKILSLQKQAGNHGKLVLFGTIYCIGIVATFLVLGLLIFGLVTGGQKQDWGQIFTHRWFTIAMALIVGVMALGMMGLFSIRLPQSVYMLRPTGDSVTGNFLMGVLTAILSTPCTGPFLGAVIAWAFKQPPWLGLVTFVVMGAGMALPYAMLILFPRMLNRMPKAGPGAELLKQVLGILLFGVAIFLLSNLTAEKWPWYAVGGVSVLGGVWAITGAWRLLRTQRGKIIVTACSLLWISLSLATTRALTDEGPVDWTKFINKPESEVRDRIAQALAQNKVVVIDFTAKWCTNCHVIERAVLNSETGVALLNADDVEPVKVDLTSAGPDQGWGLVREISGGGGIPLIAIYRPGLEKPIFFSSFFKPSDLQAAVRGE